MGLRPLPGAVHDLTAARIWGILRELAASGLVVLADKGYAGLTFIRLVRTGSGVVDLGRAVRRSSGMGSAAVMVWGPAWIVMVR